MAGNALFKMLIAIIIIILVILAWFLIFGGKLETVELPGIFGMG